jgi:hypothetical protein
MELLMSDIHINFVAFLLKTRYLNEINNFCVKKAFQSMNFHD